MIVLLIFKNGDISDLRNKGIMTEIDFSLSKIKPEILMHKKILIILSSLLVCADVLAAVVSGRYTIVSRHSGLVLDVNNSASPAGANVIQWSATGAANQQFDVSDLGNGFYSIRPVHTGMSLDVWEWSAEPGGDIRQWEYAGYANQEWIINDLGNGYNSIISAYSGLALDVWGWSTESGGDIRQWTYTGGNNQQWTFQLVGSTGRGSSCVSTGSVTVSSTIVVSNGDYDGGCKTFNPTSALGDGGQSEGQKPVFRVENGATLRNVIIGQNGADGIHFYNGGTIENIRWTDIGEDALTVKSAGNVTIRNIEAYNGYDKFMQINASTNLHISNCILNGAGKFLRQNGGTGFTINVTADNCDISNLKEAIFRTDSTSSTARITNSSLHNYGQICYGPWKDCTTSNISYY